MPLNILRLDASARKTGSVSRALTDRIIARHQGATLTIRDLSDSLPHVDETWIGANFTPADDRTDAQRETLALSDSLVDELAAADVLVIGLPIYNFGVPAGLKAWIDMVARVGRTFEYTAQGPRGLLVGKRAIVAVASGGTEMGSPIDFASGYIRHILGFLGIQDVTFVAADRLAVDPETTIKAANKAVDDLTLAA